MEPHNNEITEKHDFQTVFYLLKPKYVWYHRYCYINLCTKKRATFHILFENLKSFSKKVANQNVKVCNLDIFTTFLMHFAILIVIFLFYIRFR